MKASELPMSFIALLIIMLIAIAVGAIFYFANMGAVQNKTETTTNISSQGENQSSISIDKIFVELDCNPRCDAARSVARYTTQTEFVKNITAFTFCDRGDYKVGTQDSLHCNEVVTCQLEFNDSSKANMICDGPKEKLG
jgi:hypothetical protein